MPSSSRPQEKSVSRLIERLCSCKTELITVECCQKMRIEVAPIALEDMAAPELRPYYFRATLPVRPFFSLATRRSCGNGVYHWGNLRAYRRA